MDFHAEHYCGGCLCCLSVSFSLSLLEYRMITKVILIGTTEAF
jgi:hypothetical protein